MNGTVVDIPVSDTEWLTAQYAATSIDEGHGGPVEPETVTGRPADAFPDAQPAEVVVRDGAEVLDDVAAFVARFNVFPHEHCVP
ncbi:MAG: hypothetical protein M3443_19930, partial [Actinomycetota bacterium]|nr:hypothetical protein [Actinomycetota bacterium]